MSDTMRRVIETTEADHEALRCWESQRYYYEQAKNNAHNLVFSKGWSYATVCEAIDKLERCHAKSHALAVACDAARIDSLRAHAAAANELGRYTNEEVTDSHAEAFDEAAERENG